MEPNSTGAKVKHIIKRAGGPAAIASASGGKITSAAVYKWPEIGIPDRHWPLIIELSKATPSQLLAANVEARAAP